MAESGANAIQVPDFIQRLGKKGIKPLLNVFDQVPPRALDCTLYSDWCDPREFTVSDIGAGECAGAVVSTTEFNLQAAEQLHFEAQVKLDEGNFCNADDTAYKAMLTAARGLVYNEDPIYRTIRTQLLILSGCALLTRRRDPRRHKTGCRSNAGTAVPSLVRFSGIPNNYCCRMNSRRTLKFSG